MNSAYENLRRAEPCWKSPLILESHINGLRTKEYNPPQSRSFMTKSPRRPSNAGKPAPCGIHVHNTDMKLIGAEAFEDYMKIMGPAIRKYPDIFLVQHAVGCPRVWRGGFRPGACRAAGQTCWYEDLLCGPRGRESPSRSRRQRAYPWGGILCPVRQDQ